MRKYLLECLGQLLNVENHKSSAKGKFVNDPRGCAWFCNEYTISLTSAVTLQRSTDGGWSNAIPTQICIRKEKNKIVISRFRYDLMGSESGGFQGFVPRWSTTRVRIYLIDNRCFFSSRSWRRTILDESQGASLTTIYNQRST